MGRYVGVDLHQRRSVMVVLGGDRTELWTCRIHSDPLVAGEHITLAVKPDSHFVLQPAIQHSPLPSAG